MTQYVTRSLKQILIGLRPLVLSIGAMIFSLIIINFVGVLLEKYNVGYYTRELIYLFLFAPALGFTVYYMMPREQSDQGTIVKEDK